jgi:NAD(P)-dependent dehydrogenase (short-subunit alcohol dehydrogenase family)
MSERRWPVEILRRYPATDVELLRLDLGDLRQIADAAAEARERFGEVHICVNNAGLMVRSRTVTVDGFETTFGVNHLGHFAWTGHLLPALLAAHDSRIVTVSSLAHLQATMQWDDLMGEQTFRPVAAYRRSKIANLLHSFELVRPARLGRCGQQDNVARWASYRFCGHRRALSEVRRTDR